jgi:hypothetical protein
MRFKFCGGSDAPEWVLGEVAVLSRISCVRLKLITRQVINELAGDGALDVDKITKLVPRGPGFAWPDIKAAVAAIAFIVRQAARSDVDHLVLNAELQQLGLPRENSDGVSRPFRIHRERLRAQARADSLRAPRLLSLDWRLDAVVATSRLGLLRAHSAADAGAEAGAGAGVAAAPLGEPVLSLRLGLSHAAGALPQRISAPDLGSTRLLLSAARARAGGGEASAAPASTSAASAASATAAAAAATAVAAATAGASDGSAALRPLPVAREVVCVSLSAPQAAALLAELRIARTILAALHAAAAASAAAVASAS